MKKNIRNLAALVAALALFLGGCDTSDVTSNNPNNPGNGGGNTTPWQELDSIGVGTIYSLALGKNGTAVKLGLMFQKDTYDGSLSLPSGFGGDANALALYNFDVDNDSWSVYGGRTTPQYYKYSELVFDNGASYYTTNYPLFGGLLSVVKNGGAGAYALTGKDHDIAFLNGKLYDLVAQGGAWASVNGLTLSTFPIGSFPALGGAAANDWTTCVTLDAEYTKTKKPCLISTGTHLIGAWHKDGALQVRRTATPDSLTTGADFTAIGPALTGVADVELAWDGTYIYLATIGTDKALTVRKGTISGSSVTWSVEKTFADVDEVDICGLDSSVALALRSGDKVKVYKNITDSEVSYEVTGTFFKADLGRLFDLEGAGNELFLTLYDVTAQKVRTFYNDKI